MYRLCMVYICIYGCIYGIYIVYICICGHVNESPFDICGRPLSVRAYISSVNAHVWSVNASRVARMHRTHYLYRSFSAKEPYN